MLNKTIMITGATDGIGKQTAIELAKMGASLLIHGRSDEKSSEAVDEIIAISGNTNLNYISADLSSLSQVKEMAKNLISQVDKLDVLINNAGVYENKKISTVDGYESTFAINHLAPFLLTNLLLKLNMFSVPSRVITVSSIAHTNCDFNLDNLSSEKYFNSYNAYVISKAANILFTYKLAETLKDSGVTVNALHPGVITTKLLHKGFDMQGASLTEGAKTSVYLASSKEVEEISGKYFMDLEEKDSASFTYDIELQKKFWDVSLKMCENFL